MAWGFSPYLKGRLLAKARGKAARAGRLAFGSARNKLYRKATTYRRGASLAARAAYLKKKVAMRKWKRLTGVSLASRFSGRMFKTPFGMRLWRF